MKMVNLSLVHESDGGDVILCSDVRSDERESKYWDDFVEECDGDYSDKEVSLEEGVKMLDEYFEDFLESENEEVREEFEKKKREYLNLVSGKKGKFYDWGVEYDMGLMFIEE